MEVEKPTQSFRLFLDESSVSSFFRRPDFSPDGSLLVLPAAQYQIKAGDRPFSAVLMYRRNDFTTPCLVYSTNNKPAVCVRFCEKLFVLDENEVEEGKKSITNGEVNKPSKKNQKIFDLEYKMVFAVATIDSVIIFNTQSLQPFVIVGNIHFASLTDLAWCGSKGLGISSSDGFCSFIFFGESELGRELTQEELKEIDEGLVNLIFVEDYNERRIREVREEKEKEKEKDKEEVQQVKIIKNEVSGQTRKIIKPVMIQSFNDNV